MLLLYESPSGYALFKLLDEQKLEALEAAKNLTKSFSNPEEAEGLLKLTHFEKFKDTADALAATTATVEGKISKPLKSIIKKYVDVNADQKLMVADTKLGQKIKGKYNLQCVHNQLVSEIMRAIRVNFHSLHNVPVREDQAMQLGLAHSLSRYKLKFSPDKVDTMIIHAVGMLDDVDKELNNYIMRCREWYGWHFPELGGIISDNLAYIKTVKLIQTRDQAGSTDMSDILPEDIEDQVKQVAEVSMGTEIAPIDVLNISHLCDQIIEMSQARAQLSDYIKTRMMAIAPNLSVLLDEFIGARLIARTGSLMNLAKNPASTIQILGAEKALFRALKTKKDTPKYGLMYHSSLVTQASTRNKGKMARMTAAKAALSIRVDAFGGDDAEKELGIKHRIKLEKRLQFLDRGNKTRLSGTGKAQAKFQKYQGSSEPQQYPVAADSTLKSKKRKLEEEEEEAELQVKKKKVKLNDTEEAQVQENGATVEEADTSIKKKKKKKKHPVVEDITTTNDEPQEEMEMEQPEKKKKKKKRAETEETVQEEIQEDSFEKKKKKKKKLVSEVQESLEVEAENSEKKKKKKKKKHQDDSTLNF